MQERRRRTRETLLRTARALVAAEGFDALRTERLAREAGVSKGAVFAHFGDRDGLALALSAESLDRAGEALDRPCPDPAALVERLRPTLSLLSGDAGLWAAMQRQFCGPEGAHPELARWYAALGARLAARIAEMQAAGTARRDASPEALAEGALAFAATAAQSQHAGFVADDGERDAKLAEQLGLWLRP